KCLPGLAALIATAVSLPDSAMGVAPSPESAPKGMCPQIYPYLGAAAGGYRRTAPNDRQQKTPHLAGFRVIYRTTTNVGGLADGAQERTRTSTVLPAST